MSNYWVIVPLFFLFAGLNDFLAVQWNEARENGWLVRLSGVTGVMGAVQWFAVWFALTGENPSIIIADILGSIVGSTYGGWRYTKNKQKKAANKGCLGCCLCSDRK